MLKNNFRSACGVRRTPRGGDAKAHRAADFQVIKFGFPQAISLAFEERGSIRAPRSYFAPRAFTRVARRDTFRDPVFLWITPAPTARMISGSAACSACSAAFRSPPSMASSTLRINVLIRDRRAVLTAVRRWIFRTIFFADRVFAIYFAFPKRPNSRGSAIGPSHRRAS